jgi:integrase
LRQLREAVETAEDKAVRLDEEQKAHEQNLAEIAKNRRATIAKGWNLFMECPKRPKSCKRYMVDSIPRHTTAANYRSYYERFTVWLSEKYPEALLLSDITSSIASLFMEELQREVASGTFNKYLQFFNCFFDVLIEAEKVNVSNPFNAIDRQTHRYNSKKPLSMEQIALLIDTAKYDLQLLIALGYFTGLRLGDCCTLMWREVDLVRGIIERVPRKIETTVKDIEQARVKVGIPQFLHSLLSVIPENNRKGYVLPKFAELYLQKRDQLITKKILKHFQNNGINVHRAGTGIKKIVDPKTGNVRKEGTRAIVEIGFHSLRYSYISHNAEAGTPAAIIQRNAGHANPAMTEHYTRISDEAAVKYATALSLPGGEGMANSEPEREELHKLVDTLSLTEIQEILKSYKAERV